MGSINTRNQKNSMSKLLVGKVFTRPAFADQMLDRLEKEWGQGSRWPSGNITRMEAYGALMPEQRARRKIDEQSRNQQGAA